MARICLDTCTTEEVTFPSYTENCTPPYRRKYGYRRAIFIRCNASQLTVEDFITQGAVFQNYLLRNAIVATPKGKIQINQPSVEVFEFDACGTKEFGELTYAVDIETHEASAELLDFQYWKNFLAARGQYHVFFEACEGHFLMDPEWVEAINTYGTPNATTPSGTPGFDYSIIAPPYEGEGEGGEPQGPQV